MLPSRTLTLVHVLCVCLCSLLVGVESKLPTEEPEVNMCDIQNPDVIYCYCDIIDLNQAEEGNCWIFNNITLYAAVWEGFASQTRIKRLTLHLRPDGTLETIPTVSIHHLPELEIFEVQYATIHNLHPHSFGNSSSLEKISLSRNSIKSLSRNSFANMPAVNNISLSENQITEINRHVFVNLPKLTKLFLDRNNITTIHDKAFQDLHNLVELVLFSNQIMAITSDTFKGLHALERLDLRKNRIEVIGVKNFQDLRMLKFLELQENSLKYIAPESFVGLKKLRTLNLTDNKLLETITKETVQPIMDNMKSDIEEYGLTDTPQVPKCEVTTKDVKVGPAYPCRTPFQIIEDGCYYFIESPMDFDSAEDYCESLGSGVYLNYNITLAMLGYSHKENQAILDAIAVAEGQSYWLGGRSEDGVSWKWVDNWDIDRNALFWDQEEPNDVDNKCLAAKTVNFHNDLKRAYLNGHQCNESLKFICQFSICPLNFHEIGNYCYLQSWTIGVPQMSWQEARDYCQTVGVFDGYYGDLAVLSLPDQDDYFVLNTLMANYRSHVWIGANMTSEYSYQWIDGRELPLESIYWGREDPVGMARVYIYNPSNYSRPVLRDMNETEPGSFICQMFKNK